MNGKMNEPPLRLPRLLLIALNHIFSSTEVVASDAVTDRPTSGPVRVVLNHEFFRLIVSFARTRRVALNRDNRIQVQRVTR